MAERFECQHCGCEVQSVGGLWLHFERETGERWLTCQQEIVPGRPLLVATPAPF